MTNERVVELIKEPGARLRVQLYHSVFGHTLVKKVDETSPALGLLLPGDMLLEIDTQPVLGPDQAAELLLKAGKVRLRVRAARGGCCGVALIVAVVVAISSTAVIQATYIAHRKSGESTSTRSDLLRSVRQHAARPRGLGLLSRIPHVKE